MAVTYVTLALCGSSEVVGACARCTAMMKRRHALDGSEGAAFVYGACAHESDEQACA